MRDRGGGQSFLNGVSEDISEGMDIFPSLLILLLCQIGIIAGTGLDDPDILANREEKVVKTPFGDVRYQFN